MTDNRLQLYELSKTSLLWLDNDFAGFSLFPMPAIQKADIDFKEPITINPKLVQGKRIEILFEQLLRYQNRYEVVVHGMQVIEEKITLGELDFILRDRQTGQLVHLELVYKFYLLDGPVQQARSWIGPNRKDKLSYKINKLQKQQLPLLHHPATAKALEEFHIDVSQVRQEVCFLGQLYLPPGDQQQKLPAPWNPAALAGFWMRLTDFKQNRYADAQYFLPLKRAWFRFPDSQPVWIDHSEAIAMVEAHHHQNRSPMVWMKTDNGQTHRLFVVWWA